LVVNRFLVEIKTCEQEIEIPSGAAPKKVEKNLELEKRRCYTGRRKPLFTGFFKKNKLSTGKSNFPLDKWFGNQ